ncbi:unnamed protein product [Blepharisma stoltei]|uniref:MULE transposase domain-containing protein n=1 Tax=Blepharisma stoltei TaxID=1481888 RepID=A0AAU9K888_9CILI|nr:unnamed protein product [Blepharisma stoltei]
MEASFQKIKIANLIHYYSKKNQIEFTFESLVANKLKNENAIIKYDRVLRRFFISDKNRIDMWNNLQDVILVDSTYKVHNDFQCAVFILTLDSNGSNYALAMALCHKETIEDYIWIFSKFIKYFQHPKAIFADRNNAQYRALSTVFTSSKVFFCLWHLQRNVICHLKKSKYKLGWV